MQMPRFLARVLRVLRACRRYMWFTCVLFGTGAAIGFAVFRRNPADPSRLFALLDAKFGPMAQVMSRLDVAGMTRLVFWNNLKAAGLLVVGGIAFGLLPMAMVFLNGLIVGMVSGDVVRQGFGLLPFVLVGIAPHGLFEIPGYIIGGTLGIRLGFNLLGYRRGLQHGRGLKSVVLDTLLVLGVVVVPLLLTGSLVEVTVTRRLVEWVMGDALRWH